MMLAMIDNYDSFTYNLVQYFGELGQTVRVFRNDEITVAELDALKPEFLVISPGPCAPDQAGISLTVVTHFAAKIPILGVCLGHQSIGQAFGGKVLKAKKIMHGKTSAIENSGKGVFCGLGTFTATRYHSLILERLSLPQCLEETAWTGDGELMGIRHRQFPVQGVQFHPESIATEYGHRLLGNFLEGKI